jgi:CheY-like chemotaxis protein
MNQEKARVLIVDDDKNICVPLSDLMKKEGFETMVAYDGEKALKMLPSDPLSHGGNFMKKESLSRNGFIGSADSHHFGWSLCSDLWGRGG